jgi:hypothetical protein
VDGHEYMERIFIGDKGNREIELFPDDGGNLSVEFIYVDGNSSVFNSTKLPFDHIVNSIIAPKLNF